ncbi:MAG: type II toxin-antitoxin system VapC family toxin [Bryobacteraceae bacterium]
MTCTIARGEILFGIERLAQGRRRVDLEQRAAKILETVPCEPIPPAAAEAYARIKAAQRRMGLSLDENDLWIAATATVLGTPLVSRDGDFKRVDGVVVISAGLA